MKPNIFIVSLCISVLGVSFVHADSATSGGHMSKLNLTAEQREQVKSVMSEQKLKMEALRAETQAKINVILTVEQQAKLQQVRGSARDRIKERLPHRSGAARD